jgi:hypothetical protein
MKINGQTFDAPNEALVVFIKNGKDIPIKARAVLDFTRFDLLCPKPPPKKIKKRGGEEEILWNDPSYLLAFDHWGKVKTAYVIVESLKATPGLEFETVTDDDPSSWLKWRDEFEKAFFTDSEINKIIGCVWEANGIDEAKLNEARDRFLRGEAVEREKSS